MFDVREKKDQIRRKNRRITFQNHFYKCESFRERQLRIEHCSEEQTDFKNNLYKKIVMNKLLLFLFIFPILAIAQVGVNTSTPNAMLDVSSTNNGMLIPRVNLTSVLDNTTVVNPQGGALITSTVVYNSTAAGVTPNNVLPGFYYWNNTLSRWIPIGGTNDWSINGNSGIITPANPVTYDVSPLGVTENFLGTKDANDVVFATDNIERMRIKSTTGYIGIGEDFPQTKLDVVTNVSGLTAIHGRNRYIGNVHGRGIYSESINNPGYGTGGEFRGGYTGVYAIGNGGNSSIGRVYGVYGIAVGSTGVGTRVGGYFSATGGLNNYGLLVPDGFAGIGTLSPTHTLHVFGNIRIQNATQGVGKVLTSDATGVGTWQTPGIDNIVGVLSGTGVNIAYNQTVNFLQTGSYITLPPGRYAVNVTMLLARNSTSLPSPNNSFFWVRSSFSDSAGVNPLSSPDIVGSTLASGNFGGTSVYAMLNGTIIINNTTAGNKTYYYVAGRTVTSNTTETLTGFGSTYWAENNIIAYRLN